MSQSVIITLETTTCFRHDCGVVFGMEKEYYDGRVKDHQTFYCPNGHGQHFVGRTELDKAREALASERAFREAAERREQSTQLALRAEKGHVTRLKRRAAAGVCPCCHRSFDALRAHMRIKHPAFAAKRRP